MAYSYAEKIAILEFARNRGTIAAAEHFGVASSTVVRWNKKYQIYDTLIMRTFSIDQKIEMLQYANEHGLSNAMNHYDVDVATLQAWNKKLNVYKRRGTKRFSTTNKLPVRGSLATKMRVLEYARDNGPSAASRTYNIAISTIRFWNQELNVYPTRKYRAFSAELQSEIIAYANQHGIADAARHFKVRVFQIQDWITKQNQK